MMGRVAGWQGGRMMGRGRVGRDHLSWCTNSGCHGVFGLHSCWMTGEEFLLDNNSLCCCCSVHCVE